LDPNTNFSDHFPLTVSVLCSISAGNIKKGSSSNSIPFEQYFLRWDKADINLYYYYTGQYLEPYLQQVDEALKLSDTISFEVIDKLYNDIVSVLTSGAKLFVPTRRRNFYKFWWDHELDILKDAAINSNKIWKAAGKPRQGSLFDKRQRCRAQYRKGIRDGQKLDSMSYTNDLHDALLAKDGPSFWKSWRSKFETRSRCTQVDGCVEPEVIADKFARYFSNIYSPNSKHRAESLRSEYVSYLYVKTISDIHLETIVRLIRNL